MFLPSRGLAGKIGTSLSAYHVNGDEPCFEEVIPPNQRLRPNQALCRSFWKPLMPGLNYWLVFFTAAVFVWPEIRLALAEQRT